jgi:hypothetical protein
MWEWFFMNAEAKRNLRIQELTRMALAGKSLEQIRTRAYQLAAKNTAEEYIAEVLRRIQTVNSRSKK